MTSGGFADTLHRQLCGAFALREDGEGRWVVRTPLLYEDGDALPLVVTTEGSHWELSDDGMTISHLFFDEFEPTDARMAHLRAVADATGVQIGEEYRLSLALNDPPNEFDVGDFLQAVTAVRGAALASASEREEYTRYVTTVREQLKPALREPGWEANWPIPGTRKARYKVDMRVPTDRPDSPVALFFASTTEKTNLSALTVVHLNRAHVTALPVLAYHPQRVPSEAVFRFQEEAQDDSAAVGVTPGEIGPLIPVLRRRGVAV
jgi:hypothetical protein